MPPNKNNAFRTNGAQLARYKLYVLYVESKLFVNLCMCPKSHPAHINYLGQMYVIEQQVSAVTDLSEMGEFSSGSSSKVAVSLSSSGHVFDIPPAPCLLFQP